MIRLLCVEDDPLTRTFITTRLEAEPDMLVVSAVADIQRAMRFLQFEEIDVLLLDYQLQGEEGTKLVQSMSPWARWGFAGNERPLVLFCTGFADESFCAKARLLGARGVVAKERMAFDLIPAVRVVAGGGAWFVRYPEELAAASSPERGGGQAVCLTEAGSRGRLGTAGAVGGPEG